MNDEIIFHCCKMEKVGKGKETPWLSSMIGAGGRRLKLNVTKNKDMVMDFWRKSSHPPSQTFIKGTAIDIIAQYKYVGTVTDINLKFDLNSDAVCKTGQQR